MTERTGSMTSQQPVFSKVLQPAKRSALDDKSANAPFVSNAKGVFCSLRKIIEGESQHEH